MINHQRGLEPRARDREPYIRPEFVASMLVPVLRTDQLFDWWRNEDWAAIRKAVLAGPPISEAL